ncbi:hypothetical protein IP91_00309 [Pseudoduganella lurida]|uniref:Uncharacterized protein n=1 Tax=Pseudoduganella lurida TaxID=1036180 RepID=A0A562RJY9_9BURK|nr:hypothetical protein [Pseudoduganella lurida]TWI69243.1 hypothetical protein IP91_00309 [Pseudoduganella lurida]
MGLFKKIAALLGESKPIDELIRAYPASALEAAPSLAVFPPKLFLGDQDVHAYRTEFMVNLEDATRVATAISSEFDSVSDRAFQEGSANNGSKAVHFSLRPEFGGAVATIVTNSGALLGKIDGLDLHPSPPWIVFPEIEPETVGSLQGSIEYWWDWFFLPYWLAATTQERLRYLDQYNASPQWREFVTLHAP